MTLNDQKAAARKAAFARRKEAHATEYGIGRGPVVVCFGRVSRCADGGVHANPHRN
jgi:hypothetical protein